MLKRVLFVILLVLSAMMTFADDQQNKMVGIWEGVANVGIWKNAPQRFIAILTDIDFIIIKMNDDNPSTVFISGTYVFDDKKIFMTYYTGNDGGTMINFPENSRPTFSFKRTIDTFETFVDGGGLMTYKKVGRIIAGRS